MTTQIRLLAYLTKHGPTDYYAILKALWPLRVETINKATRELLRQGRIREAEGKEIVKLCIK